MYLVADTGVQGGGSLPFSGGHKGPIIGVPGEEDAFETALGLGELAGLTVNNEADPLSYDVSLRPYSEIYCKMCMQ